MKKTLIVILVLVVVTSGVAWYFVSFRMDSVIEQRIETTAAHTLGARVSVGAVKTDIKNGSLTISDVAIANPPGFDNPNAFSLKQVEAAVDYQSLDIKRVIIDQPDIVIEEKGGETNFSRMLAELEKMGDGSEPAGDSREPVIVIRHFRMNASRAAFESESFDRYTDLKVDAVELHDLKGTPTEIAQIIATEIVSEISQEAAIELLKAQAREKYEEAESKVTDKLKDLLDSDEGGL